MMLLESIKDKMIEYNAGDVKRINHLLKVHSFARLIGAGEGLCERELFILEAAALTHDIGIKNAEKKYGSSAGCYQEKEGPPEAEILLSSLGVDKEARERIKFLIGHHHTYGAADNIDFQALIEADFLVNAFEDNLSAASRKRAYDKIFKTETGRKTFKRLYMYLNCNIADTEV